jgi:PAS domain S-box-containing protein
MGEERGAAAETPAGGPGDSGEGGAALGHRAAPGEPAGSGPPAAVVDAHGVITACGAATCRLLGLPPGEIVGRRVAALLAGPLPLGAVHRLTAGETASAEVRLRHADGTALPLRLTAEPLHDATGGLQWYVTAEPLTPPADPPGSADRPGIAAGAGDSAAGNSGVGDEAAGESGAKENAAGESGAHPDPPLTAWTLDQLPVPVAVYDQGLRMTAANDAMTRVLGLPAEEMIGRRLREIVPRTGFEEYDRLQEQALRTGRIVHLESYARAPGDDREHAWSVYFFPLRDAAGRPRGVSSAVLDSTEHYRARRRLAVLNEASARVGRTLDVARTAQELADVAVSHFADFVSVDLVEAVVRGEDPPPPGPGPVVFHRVAQQSVLPGCPESAVGGSRPDSYPAGSPPALALATGRAGRWSADDPQVRAWIEADPERAKRVREFGIHAFMPVPLRARGTTLGLALFLRHRNPGPFDHEDQLLAEEIAARAAVCVDNARRFTRERATALALQRSMLPRGVPRQSAVEVASRYLPAGAQAGVGGDWFDVIPLSGARVALVVGDVVGHGIQASATMGRLRTAVRTLADVDLPPDELLTHLDDLVIRLDQDEGPARYGPGGPETEGEIAATCLYAVYDPVSRRCSMARAGHPPPAVVRPDGTVDFPELPAGPPLGLGGLPFEAAEFELPEGSLIALYTDGLVGPGGARAAAGTGDDAEVAADGPARLAAALRLPADTLDAACDRVLYDLLPQRLGDRPADRTPERPADDVALLLARTRALDTGQVATWHLAADPAVVAEGRRHARRQLTAWGLGDLVGTTELVVSELVTNAIRYAPAGPIRLRLIRDTALICEVSDASSTAPHLRRARTYDEGGRGLLLVAQLTDRWGTRHTSTGGKTIWAEQRLP